jgi:phosphoribosylformylglycinamidine synthase subunit PurL
VGAAENDINSSEYLYSYHEVKLSPAPAFDLETEYQVQAATKEIIRQRLVQSVHDVSDGGLYIALLESAMPNNLGFRVNTEGGFRKDAYLFGESQSRIVISVAPAKQTALETTLKAQNISFTNLGTVTTGENSIDQEAFQSTADIKQLYDTSLEKLMN